MGQPVCLLASISDDFLGERLMGALKREGVQTSLVERNHNPTTLSLVGLNAQRVPTYAFYGDSGADRQLSLAALEQVPRAPDVLHFASYSAVIDPIASTLRALVERERGGSLISYDPNIRLNVEPDIGIWLNQIEWMIPRTHLLKISDEDLSLVLPQVDMDAFAMRTIEMGVKLVVVTRGSKGAKAWNAQGVASTESTAAKLVDTVGAGDSFQAALLTWLAENTRASAKNLANMNSEQLKAALTFASRAAAITCSRQGADMPYRKEILQ